MRQARIVTACSAFTLRNLEAFAKPTCPSLVIQNGVDPEEFPHSDSTETGFDRYVFAAGRLVPRRGSTYLSMPSQGRAAGLNLVIAGDGFAREALSRQAADLGIMDRVCLIGAVDRERLTALMRGAVAFAFPSRGEAFGIALLEAMAAGVPAVAAAAGGVPELARDGENALVVPPRAPPALSSALARLVNDPELRSRLSAGGQQTARELAWSRSSSAMKPSTRKPASALPNESRNRKRIPRGATDGFGARGGASSRGDSVPTAECRSRRPGRRRPGSAVARSADRRAMGSSAARHAPRRATVDADRSTFSDSICRRPARRDSW